MADPSNTAAPPKGPVLLPQGEHAGKPGLPLGQRLFTLVGSRNRAHLHLLSNTISRNHACIVYGKDGIYIRDLASRSGILINGRRVREADLQEGDLVQIGSFSFKFQDPSDTIHLATRPMAPLAMFEMDRRTFTPLDGRTLLIGRRHSCDIPLDFPDVSSTHTIIFESDGRRFVRDLGSRSGTLVNGTAVHQQVLEFGDEIRVGATTFRYVAADAAADETADAGPALELEPDLGELDSAEEDLTPIGLDFDETVVGHDAAPAAMIDDAPLPISEVDFPDPPAPAPVPLDLSDDPSTELDAISAEGPLKPNSTTWPETPEAELDLGLDFWEPQATPEVVADSIGAAPLEPAAVRSHEPPETIVREDQASVPHSPTPTVAQDADGELDLGDFSLPPDLLDQGPVVLESGSVDVPRVPQAQSPPLQRTPGMEVEAGAIEPVYAADLEEIAPEANAPAEAATTPSIAPSEPETPSIEPTVATAPSIEPTEPAKPWIEPTVTTAPLIEPTEPAENATPPETRVEDVDLSAVKFDAEAWTPEASAEAPQVSAEPTPLLDLAPGDLAGGGEEPAIEIPPQAEEPAEAPPPAKRARKPRAPRKKLGKNGARAAAAEVGVAGPEATLPPPVAAEISDASDPAAPAPRGNETDAPIEAGPIIAESRAVPKPAERPADDEPADSPLQRAAAGSAEDPAADVAAPFDLAPTATTTAEEELSPAAPPDSPMDSVAATLESQGIEATAKATPPMTDEAAPESVELVVPSERHGAAADSVETIGGTEPTLESALDMGDSLAPLQPPSAAPEMVDVDLTLTDTAFGRAVQDFTGSGLGPLVEEQAPASSFAPPPATQDDDRVDVAPAEPHSPDAGAEWTVSDSELSFDDSPASLDEGQTLTGEFSLDAPIETDWSSAPPQLDFGLDETVEPPPATRELSPDFEIDDSLAQAPLDLDNGAVEESLAPPSEALNFDLDDAATHTESAATQPPADAGPSEEAPSAPPAASDEIAAPASRPALDPYFGMRRDMGSFIGGMPLGLTPGIAAAPVSAPQGGMASGSRPIPPHTAPASSKEEEDEEALPAEEWLDEEPAPAGQSAALSDADEDLFEGEEPLELFDETADQLDALPDDLQPIQDIDGVLANATPTAAAPKTPPLRSLTGSPAHAAAPPVKVPPFAESRSARAGANPFAGLATPNLRGTDVFSQTAFPPPDEALFQPQPVQDIAPTTIRAADAAHAHPAASRDAWRPPAGQTVSAAPPPAPQPAPRKPWWKNIRTLLPLLALLIAAAVMVVIRFFPPPAVVQGTLRLKGLDNKDLSWAARKAQVLGVRDLLAKPALREIVVQNLRAQGVSPGFVQNPAALAALADPQNAPFDQKRQSLMLTRRTTDPRGDKTRMAALLSVVYTDNLTSAEGAPGAQQRAAEAAARLQSLRTQLAAQQASARKMSEAVTAATGASAQELLMDPAAAAQSLQSKEVALTKTLADANAAVNRRQEAIDQMQAASLSPGVAPDPRLMTTRQTLAALKARLGVLKVAQGGAIDSGKAFAGALQSAEDDLGLIVATTRDPSISAYAARARQAAEDIRALIGRQRQNAQRAAEVRAQLAAHRQTHLEQLWSGDDTLKQMLGERDGLARRTAAAQDGAVAAKASGVLDDLDQKIDARRQALATGGQDADDLRQSLQQALDGIEQDQLDNGLRINQDMALLDVPPVNRVKAPDQAAIAALGEQIAGVKAAADPYVAGKTTASTAADQTRDLQNQIADQRARLDAYEQRQASSDAVVAARRVLDASEQTQAKAQKAYLSNLQLMASLRRLGDAQAQIAEVTGQIATAQSTVERSRADAADIPVLIAPDENSVQEASEPDLRVWYLAGAIGGLLALFAVPLWLAIREPAPDAPMAMIVAEDRDLPGRRALQAYSEPHLLGDDERTAVA